MVLYMIPMVTNPIFINIIVVFVRLYYFEREFKDIRARSKQLSKFRRNFTREMTIASGIDPDQSIFQRMKHKIFGNKKRLPTVRTNTHGRFITPRPAGTAGSMIMSDDVRDLEYGVYPNRNAIAINPAYKTDGIMNDKDDSSDDHVAPPPIQNRAISFNDPVKPSDLRNAYLTSVNGNSNHQPLAPDMNDRDIRFADLPKPSGRKDSIQASDIARSIMTLERRSRAAHQVNVNGDAPLVIKTVQEVEQEEEERQRRLDDRLNGRRRHRKWKRPSSFSGKNTPPPMSFENTIGTGISGSTAFSSRTAIEDKSQPEENDDDYDYEQDRIYNSDRGQRSESSSDDDDYYNKRRSYHKLPKSHNAPESSENKPNGSTLSSTENGLNNSTVVASPTSTTDNDDDDPISQISPSPTTPQNRTIRIAEAPKPSKSNSKWPPLPSTSSPSSIPPAHRRASAPEREIHYNGIDDVLEDEDNMFQTAQEGTESSEVVDPEEKEPKRSLLRRLSLANASVSTTNALSEDDENRPYIRRLTSHIVKKATGLRRNSSSSDESEMSLKRNPRAKSLDRADKEGLRRTKSFEQMLNNRKRANANFAPNQENNNDDTNLSSLPRAFSRAATTEDDDMYSGGELVRSMSTNYLSYQPNIGGNSVFVNLNDAQKEELGGVEYRALKLLAKLLVAYYVGWHIIAVTLILPWSVRTITYRTVFEEDAISPAWWGIFTAASAFNNLGLTLTPDSLASFEKSLYVLILVPFLMIIGNTGFPIFLRCLIWVMFKISNPYGRMRESLGFLLDHPRRCFTLLFPSGPTWWLFAVLMSLNLIDTILFLLLDLQNPAVTSIPVGYRIMSGFFQAISTRTTGFGILNIGDLHPAVIVSYTIMMYINIFPVAMSVRHTNVYEEQTLGLYRPPTQLAQNGNFLETPHSKSVQGVTTHLMRQLSYDLWFMFIALFIICITEEHLIVDAVPNVPIFSMLFEVTSAYGTVGLSAGYPNIDMSLSSKFSVIGKLVIIALLYRGRHRSLPYAIDRAIILPSSKMIRNDMAQERVIRNWQAAQENPVVPDSTLPLEKNGRMYTMASGYSTNTSLNNRRTGSRPHSMLHRNGSMDSIETTEVRPSESSESWSSFGSPSIRSASSTSAPQPSKKTSIHSVHRVQTAGSIRSVRSGASVRFQDEEEGSDSVPPGILFDSRFNEKLD